MIHIYTDGSCIGNPGKGGWAFCILEEHHALLYSGREDTTTNNRMEITAVVECLEFVKKNTFLTIHSDSKLVINCAKRIWKRHKNLDLWEKFDHISSNIDIQWIWVKAHCGDYFNELVDKLAREEARK